MVHLSPTEIETLFKEALPTMIKQVVSWAGGYLRRPSKAAIEKKAEELLAANPALPQGEASVEQRARALELIVPTLEEVVRFSKPTPQDSDIVRSTVKKNAAKKSASGFRPAGGYPGRPHSGAFNYGGSYTATKKSASKKTAAKKTAAKATARKTATKKTAAKKTATRKTAAKTPRRASFR